MELSLVKWDANMHKVFISYHHASDQYYKDSITQLNARYGIFVDLSVNSGEIDDTNLSDEQIRIRVRDQYLRESTVTIVLVGTETRLRKHVDWELYSSMRDGVINKQSGIILVNLPSTGVTHFHAGHGDFEKKSIYPENASWASWNKNQYESNYPYFSRRMIDNLDNFKSNISVVPWNKIENNPNNLSILIDLAYNDRAAAIYDLSTPMRRRNG